MLTKEDFAVIKALHERGVYQEDIALQMGVHPKTVSRALARGAAPKRERAKRGSKLEPYKATVDRLLGEGVWNAVVILREIQAEGYTGGITVLRMYVIPKRSLRPTRSTVRFETEPGRQMQSDWGEILTTIAGVPTKVYFIVNLLGFSRRMHFWCTTSLDAEHTFEGIVRSFEYFGGVTAEVLVDNQKVAVLSHQPKEGPRFQERFLDLAGHCCQSSAVFQQVAVGQNQQLEGALRRREIRVGRWTARRAPSGVQGRTRGQVKGPPCRDWGG